MLSGVYLVLDPDQTIGRSPVEVAEAALRGGVGAVQWRQKDGTFRRRWSELLAVRELCAVYEVPLLINDRVDVALAVEADGAHLGQDDLPADAARRLLPDGLLGVSITDLGQIEAAVGAGADYLGIGPIFPTRSKGDASPALGLEALRHARDMTELPLVAIGGIGLENAPQVHSAGADALAVISAICSAPDVEAATRRLVCQLEGAGHP